jgi:alkylhydroperoxidase/carboxymuconolactone decarboxylase family protein YurZ
MHTVIETPVFIQSAKQAGVTDQELQQIITLLASTPIGTESHEQSR